ncbi:MAG TPA: pyridoxal-dependent decarboxylase [Actinomycetales bacterium]|nr:pyridoxal-dependent decarboxylase [Actinomycetales bacterium]
MTTPPDRYDEALDRAITHARAWLGSLDDRSVPARASIAEVAAALGPDLPAGPSSAADVVDTLARACEPGLAAMPSGRFFGFVIGGTHPAALAADWLVSAWDQNSAMRQVTPAHSAVEDAASRWVLDLLGLPREAAVGFVTGATMANFTCLAAGRHVVLKRAGWDAEANGLAGGPRVRVLAGAERHVSVDLALRYLGLGSPETVAVDDEGRVRVDALAEALLAGEGAPTIVALQAGNIHSGAFDPFEAAIETAQRHGAWVHVDGAFGLFAAASPSCRHLVTGYEAADSWATDAHKTLNVPYDSGIAIVRDRAAHRAALGAHGEYLLRDDEGDSHELVPEMSRRGRALPVWAVLRSLGRDGVADLVARLCTHAQAFAAGLSAIDGVEVLNDIVFTQVCAAFEDDARTQDVVDRLLRDGTAWITGSRWQGRAVLRISVSNWSTTSEDVARSLAALRRAASVA